MNCLNYIVLDMIPLNDAEKVQVFNTKKILMS